MSDPLREMLEKRKIGMSCGIASFCTANEIVIEAVMEQAKRFDDSVLIEATANQVNQFGGYTGMTPEKFRDFVYKIAENISFPLEKIILGGDHLGPLIWSEEPEKAAMEKAIELVEAFVRAGYKKIHLDTSMRLADDLASEPLSDNVIAERGARLYEACEKTYQELKNNNPGEKRPVYIIGSEVPIPGGARETEESIEITKPEAIERTIKAYEKAFEARGMVNAFENIIGVVVQPGVEFSDEEIFHYDRGKAANLCRAMKKYGDLVLEGHSTDYQSPIHLKEMVEDGIAILKVGPALTFALREGLFALSNIEKELLQENRAEFIQKLEQIMLDNPNNWEKHYKGTGSELAIKRKYSFSDRCRYYFAQPELEKAIVKLLDNLDGVNIPLSMLQQYMPMQYIKVRDNRLPMKARELLKDAVTVLVEDYNYAVKHHYIVSGIFV